MVFYIMKYPSLRQIESFIEEERFLTGNAWNGPIPINVKQVKVRHNGTQKVVGIKYMGSDQFDNGKKMDFWRIDLDYKTIISSTFQFSNRHRCVGPFNFYLIKEESRFELYKGPKQFSILECL